MLKKLLILLSIVFMQFPIVAEEVSIRWFGGINKVSSELPSLGKCKIHDGHILGGAVGRVYSRFLRSEFEASYRYNEVNKIKFPEYVSHEDLPLEPYLKVKLESFSLLANIIASWPSNSFFQPYFGAGLGGTRVWHRVNDYKRHGISIHFITGVHLPEWENYYCGAEFRLLSSQIEKMNYTNKSFIFTCHKKF